MPKTPGFDVEYRTRQLDEGRYTDRYWFCMRCGYAHSDGVLPSKRIVAHRKFKITSVMWNAQQGEKHDAHC